ncbi:maleylpyruvate isomerase N-terminal domain-containing protein [Quadrisphaera sp. INWT6]|uniref:maleylpyruvate isomerase N-terminal domain-containing protein n=1 Tax=Quadrisphaera sp. INWT6 TaxID=2596917 RepID=UPI001892088B|nr:maleylpyruvate isomerase N-terminal domain-containing protein [Quadrisphaera sp. INWT6]MBF5082364.1 hypothetical protein [Quadrisphaera sp. INWT6]
MALTFVSSLERSALVRAAGTIAPLVSAVKVGAAWEGESVLPEMTVGGLTRHLVNQFETALAFLVRQPPPAHAEVVSLAELYGRSDWFSAPADAVENTSIRDNFNAMADGGQEQSVTVLARAREELPAAIAAAGPLTYVPWQDCTVTTEDFLAARLMEVFVHADDLAASVGLPAPDFDDDVAHPVVALLAMLSALQHGSAVTARWLARTDRAEVLQDAFRAPSQ